MGIRGLGAAVSLRRGLVAMAVFGACLAAAPAGAAVSEQVLYSFSTGTGSGQSPSEAGLVEGSDGRLYGTLYGSATGSCPSGSIFAIAPASGSLVNLHSFSGTCSTGAPSNPKAALLQGDDGNFYGTTYRTNVSGGAGVIFKITPSGVFSLLHTFGSTAGEGANPAAELVKGSDGNFYGTTENGGTSGNGTIYMVTPAGAVSTLHSFAGSEGSHPTTRLLLGQDGRFYGTTSFGGSAGHGSIYAFTTGSGATALYSFSGGADGSGAVSALVQGAGGYLYGTTQSGGAGGHGNVFRLSTLPNPNSPDSGLSFATQYSFAGGATGDTPHGSLILGSDGNLYGTTYTGGASNNGTAYRITPAGSLTTLYSFGAAAHDAVKPYTPLVQTSDGAFYGIANGGSNNSGAIFGLSGVFTAPPPAPALNAPSAGDAQVSLSWSAAAGATSYSVYQGTAAGAEAATPVKSAVTATATTLSGLVNGKTYYFQVAAVGEGGVGGRSNEVSATPVAVPAGVAGLAATPGNAQVTLHWNAAAGATSYIVYRGTTAGGETPLATGVTTTSYTASGLTNGTTYYFEVAGVNSSGTGARSAEASAKPASDPGSSSSGGSSSGSSSSSSSSSSSGGSSSSSSGSGPGGGGGHGGGSANPLLLAAFALLAARRRRHQG
jgi:uncharacterized repeat protein (TIGR03803 family)